MNKKILILEELKRYAIDTASRIRKLSTEKVDKQDGKGLSSNDFTTSEKEKLKDIGIATEDKPGLVKPDGDTITMDMDGTLHGTTIDELFSLTSTNPVQNKVAKAKFDEIEEKVNANETTILSHTTALATLNGEGEGSVKKTVTDEIAKVVADAPESLDTLKEISDWISSHESDASAMNSAIQANKSDIATLQTDKVDKETGKSLLADTDKANYDDAVSKAHSHDNKSVLDGITSDKVTYWDNKSEFGGNYNDLSDKPTIPKGDGTTITMDEDGTLHGQSVDIATTEKTGIVKPDGDTIEVSTDATISVSSKALTFSDHDTATSGTSFTDAEDGNMLVTDWTKNLLNPTLETTEQNGITCTNNGDGTYTLNGTATDDFCFEVGLVKNNKFTNKTCLLIDCGKAANSSDKHLGLIAKETTTWVWVSANDSNDYKVILSEYYCTKCVSVRIQGVKGDSYNNAIIKPMLTTDLSATYDDFVPYGGYEIQSCGKNLWSGYNIEHYFYGDGSKFNDDCISSDFIPTNGNTKIHIGYSYNWYIGYSTYDRNKKRLSIHEVNSNDIAEKGDYAFKSSDFSSDGSVEYIKVMFYKLEDTPYVSFIDGDFEPYTGETITVTNDTESPAFGLKSHKGITNIISLGNVKCVYPTNESGKGVLDSLYNKDKMLTEQNKSLDVIGKCKNLLNPTLQTTTQNGVTCTNNGDGTYTLNGTASSDAYFVMSGVIYDKNIINKYEGSKLVGAPSGSSNESFFLFAQFNGAQPTQKIYIDCGNGIKLNNIKGYETLEFIICVKSGKTVPNLTFKPMLTTDLSATYDDFVPYTGEGETLTHDVAEIKNDLGGLFFSASGKTLSITDGTNTWTLEANS